MTSPRTLTQDQCKMLLANLLVVQGTEHQKLRGMRNQCMAVVMLETGVRVAELCGLIVSDLWFAGQPVEVLRVREEIAKNKKERHIPISTKLCEAIGLMFHNIWYDSENAVFGYAFSFGSLVNRLSTRSVERIILSASVSAFNVEVTPHMLRHTFASRMMKVTNIRVVQELLGHANLQSTQVYTHPDLEDLKKAINGD